MEPLCSSQVDFIGVKAFRLQFSGPQVPLIYAQACHHRPSHKGEYCNIQYAAGLLSNQGEKSINFYFIRVPLRRKVLKYGTPKPRQHRHRDSAGLPLLGFKDLYTSHEAPSSPVP